MPMKAYSMMSSDAMSRFAEEVHPVRARLDKSLPFNLQIGSRVRLPETPFTRSGENSRIAYPGEESTVVAYSENIMAGHKTYRFYLENIADKKQESLLLLMTKDDEMDEIVLFCKQAEIPILFSGLHDVPEKADIMNAFSFWLDDVDGAIGMPSFSQEETVYTRLWEPESKDRIPPIDIEETIYLDPYGDAIKNIEHMGTMIYTRSEKGLSNEFTEYLMPSLEMSDEGFRTRIWVGIPLAVSDLGMS